MENYNPATQQMKAGAEQAARDLKAGADHAAHNLKENVTKIKNEAAEGTDRLVTALREKGTVVRDYVDRYPGRVAVASLAVGFLLGALRGSMGHHPNDRRGPRI